MSIFLKIVLISVFVIIFVVVFFLIYAYFIHEQNWYVEENVVRTEEHPLAGFWKNEGSEENPWGWAIGPASPGIYYISFCGPNGCFAEGTYLPNTSIVNDPEYKVIDENTIMMPSKKGLSKVVRCPGRT
jgi:hypothetical protein